MLTRDRRAQIRRRVCLALWASPVRYPLERLPFVRRIYDGWSRAHPFDAVYGTDTSATIPVAKCAPDVLMAAQMSPYGASQPSIVRAGIASLPQHDQYAFVDLGCGKGRPLIVASEFPFRQLVGIEIAPALVDMARRNAALVAMRYPARTPIEIRVGDATGVSPPAERVVYFMYHPFSRALVTAIVSNIERLDFEV